MMKRRITVGILAALICLILAGCGCRHQWDSATCQMPKTCTQCGETEGEPLSHEWRAATCQQPQTCLHCGAAEGAPLPHTWEEATCLLPKTCTQCKTTTGTAGAHREGPWETIETNYAEAVAVSRRVCTLCEKELDLKEEPLKTLHNGSIMLTTPAEFLERMRNSLPTFLPSGYGMSIQPGEYYGDFTGAVTVNQAEAGYIFFYNGSDIIAPGQKDSQCFDNMGCAAATPEDLLYLMVSAMLACDPALDMDDVQELTLDVTRAGEGHRNGITYTGKMNNGLYYFGFEVD